MAKISISAPTPTSTMATVGVLVAPELLPPPLLLGPVELPDGFGEAPESPPGITVQTIMTMPRAMTPTPRAHRA